MLTEQEAVAQLNKRIENSNIKARTKRYLDKIKVLQSRLEAHNASIKDLELKKASLDQEMQRVKGAISILLELSAEEENLLAEDSESNDSSI